MRRGVFIIFGIVHYEIFFITAVLLNLMPGPDTLFILSRSISQGRITGIYSVLGTSAGCLVHTVFASLGLSIILSQSALAFSIVKLAGALYLGYLGITTLLAQSNTLVLQSGKTASHKSTFWQGLLVDVLNPKVALFFLSFLPQFIEPQNQYGALPFILLGLTFILTGTIWLLILVCFSASITTLLRQSSAAAKLMDKVCGSIYLLLGIKLLAAERE